VRSPPRPVSDRSPDPAQAATRGSADRHHRERRVTTLTADDDTLHRPTSDDLFWTETSWFAFAVPERRMTGAVYPVFRTNQGVCSVGVYVWDDAGEGVHEIPYAHNLWHLPLPDDLRSMSLPGGLSLDVEEPLRRYHVRYDDERDLVLDLRYEALVEPFVSSDGAHLDQPCRVEGRIVLGGEEIPVSCVEMRDRSWSVRPDLRTALPDGVRVAYTYGHTDDGDGFQLTTFSFEGSDAMLRGGYLLRDGELRPLASGARRIERGRPVRIEVEGADADGRSFHATGRTVNRFAFQATPGLFAWMSGTAWELDGAAAWGQDQDMCTPASRVAALRSA
jgi:hypothetical protein